MTSEEIKKIQKFITDPDWVLIERIIQNSYSLLKLEPDEKTKAYDFKAQVLANQKLLSCVEKFLAEAQVCGTLSTDKKNPFQ